uniref:Uncharacterized protein n=1 Tax=Knipowitschia caucasica TaxID=637954 RepID=A0AAV2L8F4_KNICA
MSTSLARPPRGARLQHGAAVSNMAPPSPTWRRRLQHGAAVSHMVPPSLTWRRRLSHGAAVSHMAPLSLTWRCCVVFRLSSGIPGTGHMSPACDQR